MREQMISGSPKR